MTGPDNLDIHLFIHKMGHIGSHGSTGEEYKQWSTDGVTPGAQLGWKQRQSLYPGQNSQMAALNLINSISSQHGGNRTRVSLEREEQTCKRCLTFYPSEVYSSSNDVALDFLLLSKLWLCHSTVGTPNSGLFIFTLRSNYHTFL